MSHTTVCPKCHVKSQVDQSLIGRFITCEKCRCLYYVVVPALGEDQTEWQAIPATSPAIGPGTAQPLSAEQELFRTRVQWLTALVVLNLLVSGVVLVILLVRALK